ncbi:MAG: hypothetical protein EKK40_09655 [Bradyrhizobiaceae bacterium]|nr:MAG: hypothetical protein EKK40_09655 [Bradyrhizobiaceae bacterium]
MRVALLKAVLVLSFICNGIAHAEEVGFYYKETDGFWTVRGGANTSTGQATCFGEASRNDGSSVEIHRSLVDGEMWAYIHDTAWEIQSPEKGILHWNFFGTNHRGLIDGADFEYEVKDKNTILVLQIKPKPFSEKLWNSRYFVVVMPGNLQNLSISFETQGSTMLAALAECIKQNEKTYKDFKPSLEKVPDAVKEQL